MSSVNPVNADSKPYFYSNSTQLYTTIITATTTFQISCTSTVIIPVTTTVMRNVTVRSTTTTKTTVTLPPDAAARRMVRATSLTQHATDTAASLITYTSWTTLTACGPLDITITSLPDATQKITVDQLVTEVQTVTVRQEPASSIPPVQQVTTTTSSPPPPATTRAPTVEAPSQLSTITPLPAPEVPETFVQATTIISTILPAVTTGPPAVESPESGPAVPEISFETTTNSSTRPGVTTGPPATEPPAADPTPASTVPAGLVETTTTINGLQFTISSIASITAIVINDVTLLPGQALTSNAVGFSNVPTGLKVSTTISVGAIVASIFGIGSKFPKARPISQACTDRIAAPATPVVVNGASTLAPGGSATPPVVVGGITLTEVGSLPTAGVVIGGETLTLGKTLTVSGTPFLLPTGGTVPVTIVDGTFTLSAGGAGSSATITGTGVDALPSYLQAAGASRGKVRRELGAPILVLCMAMVQIGL